MEKTYKIVRFNESTTEQKIIKTGLTLTEAKNHCQDINTSGDGWFDGFTEE